MRATRSKQNKKRREKKNKKQIKERMKYKNLPFQITEERCARRPA